MPRFVPLLVLLTPNVSPSQIDNVTGLLLFLSPREDGTVRETDEIVVSVNESAIEIQHGIKNADGSDSPAPVRFESLTIGYALRSAVNVAVYTADQEDRKMMLLSRFVALSVSLTLNASRLQPMWRTLGCMARPAWSSQTARYTTWARPGPSSQAADLARTVC
eukprot:COSAG06_NODE_749_length_12615_cov_35.521333_7_plen_163_part_00